MACARSSSLRGELSVISKEQLVIELAAALDARGQNSRVPTEDLTEVLRAQLAQDILTYDELLHFRLGLQVGLHGDSRDARGQSALFKTSSKAWATRISLKPCEDRLNRALPGARRAHGLCA